MRLKSVKKSFRNSINFGNFSKHIDDKIQDVSLYFEVLDNLEKNKVPFVVWENRLQLIIGNTIRILLK